MTESGFDLSFWSAVVKIYPFWTLCWVKELKYVAKQVSPAHRTIYFSQLLKRNLSETIASHTQPTFIWLNSIMIIKYVQG